MSDSGLSLCSGPSSSDHKETDIGDTMDNGHPGNMIKTPHCHLSKSVANLSTLSPLSPSLSRSDSISSLNSTISSGTMITAAEIRSLTNNYQKMLKGATAEIKKLNVEKWKLEQEQDKLLNTNIELAEEVRKFVASDKELKAEKKELLAVNEEFATEVEKLYKNEVKYLNENDDLKRQVKGLQQKYDCERQKQSNNIQGEQSKLENQISKLTESLHKMKIDYENLLENNKLKEKQLANKQDDILTNQERDLNRLQHINDKLQSELDQERKLRQAGEEQIRLLKVELRRTEKDIHEMSKSQETAARKHSENLSAENFEYAVENNELKKKLAECQDKEKQQRKQLQELKTENQWLIQNQKKSGDSPNKRSQESHEKQLDMLRNELKEERDKVKNLTGWKSQLSDKNKELKEENDKLINKVEDLERLMNEEVTDINEILNVINTIQVDKNVPEMKQKGQRYF